MESQADAYGLLHEYDGKDMRSQIKIFFSYASREGCDVRQYKKINKT